MGIYSHNRVAGVAANVNEATSEVEATMENFELTPDFSIGCTLEAVLQMYENDAKMFDTLIECDFMEAENGFIMNESEAQAVNEAADEKKSEGIVAKIKAAINKFIEFIKSAAGNLIRKFNDLVGSDKKIAEQYKNVLTVDNLEGFKGIPNFASPKYIDGKIINAGFEQYAKTVSNYANDMGSSVIGSREEAEKILGKFKQETEEFMKAVEDNLGFINSDSKVENWKFEDDAQIKFALELLSNSSKVTKDIKKNTQTIIGSLKGIEVASKVFSKKNYVTKKMELSSEESANAKAIYDFISGSIKGYSKLFNAYTKALIREYGQVRKAVIICGRAAVKGSKGAVGEAVDMDIELAVENAIMESSDVFMMEHFEYAY